jgi:phosphatidylglycerophosphate synthase
MSDRLKYPGRIGQIAEATHDIVTPANVITIIGLGLSAHGAAHIYKLSGVIEFGAGRILDLADGFVARRTYESRTGAILDGTVDKIAVAAIVLSALIHKAAPIVVLLIIAAYNLINMVSTIYAELMKAGPKTVRPGKYAMFLQNVALGSFILGNALNHNHIWDMLGWFVFSISVPVASLASYLYIQSAIKIVKNPKR